MSGTNGQSFAFNVDDKTYTLALPLTIANSIRLRTELGWSQPQLMGFMQSPDLDVMAVCVWLARLQAGDDVSFAEVSKSISYDSKFSVGLAEDDHPES